MVSMLSIAADAASVESMHELLQLQEDTKANVKQNCLPLDVSIACLLRVLEMIGATNLLVTVCLALHSEGR